MKRFIKHKPLSNEEIMVVSRYKSPLIFLLLKTGARIAEAHRIINNYNPEDSYIDIKTKKSGENTNRVYIHENLRAMFVNGEFDKVKGMTVRTLQNRITRASEMTKIKFSAHNLRATFATQLLENGVDLVSVQHLMNHKDISMTATYIQFSEGKLVSSIDTLFNPVTFEGMNLGEAKSEIIRLRQLLKRKERSFNSIKESEEYFRDKIEELR